MTLTSEVRLSSQASMHSLRTLWFVVPQVVLLISFKVISQSSDSDNASKPTLKWIIAHILQSYFTGNVAIAKLFPRQWTNPDVYKSLELNKYDIIATTQSTPKLET